MSDIALHRPMRLDDAVRILHADPMARAIAGGQSLLPAVRLDLATPSALVDLSLIPGLDEIRAGDDWLEIGAMCTHVAVASSAVVRERLPSLAELAAHIADAQVRNLGTIGGSIANNDPAACYPAAVLACEATIVTDRRAIPVDEFFDGLFTTALSPDELIVSIRFPLARTLRYGKFEQQASRFALVGVAVSSKVGTTGDMGDADMRIAITGSPGGVFLLPSPGADIDEASVPESRFDSDLHASAAYRAQLARVLLRRLLAGGQGQWSGGRGR